MAEELKACRNCGGKCDPTGWMRGDGRQGPECEGCGITTPDVESWNRLMGDQLHSQGGEAVAWQVVGVHPKHRHWHRVVEYTEKTPEGQAAHWRNRGCTVEVTPLYTHPADQVAEGVVVGRELLERATNFGRPDLMEIALGELRTLLATPSPQ